MDGVVRWFNAFVIVLFILTVANIIAGQVIEWRYIAATTWIVSWLLCIRIEMRKGE